MTGRVSLFDGGINGVYKRVRDSIERHHEAEVRRMLEMWVSELEPVIAYNRRGRILGLCAREPMSDDGQGWLTLGIIIEARPFYLEITT